MPSTSTPTPTPTSTSTTTTTANNKNKIPLSDLSKGEYELWKDAQLIGHFESWKRERRENKSRIERLEAEVAELRRAVVELKLESTILAKSFPPATLPLLPCYPRAATSITTAPVLPSVVVSTTDDASTPTASDKVTAEGGSGKEGAAAPAAAVVSSGSRAGNGVKWADREKAREAKEKREREREGGVRAQEKKLPSMCDVE